MGWIAGFKAFDFVTSRTNLCINIKLLKEKGMSGIIGRKGQMKCVPTVTSDYRRIFTITEAPDVNVPVGRFMCKELAYKGGNKTETENNYKKINSIPSYLNHSGDVGQEVKLKV